MYYLDILVYFAFTVYERVAETHSLMRANQGSLTWEVNLNLEVCRLQTSTNSHFSRNFKVLNTLPLQTTNHITLRFLVRDKLVNSALCCLHFNSKYCHSKNVVTSVVKAGQLAPANYVPLTFHVYYLVEVHSRSCSGVFSYSTTGKTHIQWITCFRPSHRQCGFAFRWSEITVRPWIHILWAESCIQYIIQTEQHGVEFRNI